MEIELKTIDAPEYPRFLKEIFDPPGVLYGIGNWDILKKPCVAIVGTRRASSYGEQQAFRFARDLSRQGICVVSGLAFGIDAAAHEGALEGPGGTVAVLAHGLTTISPRNHRGLAKKILAHGGLLLSEKENCEIAYKSDFLVRNRIIAGICPVTLVMEAGFKSGAMNTARHARDQGREVMALPGRITEEGSQGVHSLIMTGAALLDSPRRVLEILGMPWKEKEALALKGFTKLIFESLQKDALSLADLCTKYENQLQDLYNSLGELELRGLIRLTQEQRYTAL